MIGGDLIGDFINGWKYYEYISHFSSSFSVNRERKERKFDFKKGSELTSTKIHFIQES